MVVQIGLIWCAGSAAGQVGHGYDFVEGSFVSNPRAIDRGGELIPRGHQLSVHTQTAASLLDRSLR